MPKPTGRDLIRRAQNAIERDEPLIYDVGAETGQIVGNIRHTWWFVREVANWLIDNEKKWAHLPYFGPASSAIHGG